MTGERDVGQYERSVARLLVRKATVKKLPSKKRKKRLRKLAQASKRKNRH
jgi:hypothetical protein